MPNCQSCTAPLPADTGRCSYCGTRNDMDLSALNRYAISRTTSPRYCPDCEIPLQTITLELGDKFAIERCERCYGLFFDPGEVQAVLEASVAPVFEINYRQILNVSEERGSKDRPVRYIKCPDCGKMMNRVAFGFRSGVVVDQCKAHGVWLDNGELIQLMEWKRAGGQMLDEQRERKRQEEQLKSRTAERNLAGVYHVTYGGEQEAEALDIALDELANSAVRFISKLFR